MPHEFRTAVRRALIMQRIAAPMPESGKGAAMLHILCITRAKEPRSERGSREREREREMRGGEIRKGTPEKFVLFSAWKPPTAS